MEITIELLVTTLFGNRIVHPGDQVTVTRERANTLIQRGHAKPVEQVVNYETADRPNPSDTKKETATRKTRKRKSTRTNGADSDSSTSGRTDHDQ